MRMGAWLVWVPWVCTWMLEMAVVQSRGPGEPGLDWSSKNHAVKNRVKEHVGHAAGDKQTAHRGKVHRKKGFRVRAEESAPRIVHHPSDLVVRVGSPATLSCRADGSPKPSIEWLHDGQPVDSELGDSHLQPIVLSEGSIFFLSVTGGKRGLTHEGVYTCVATNSAGTATSRNASLYIAALQEEFSLQPSDVVVSEGEVAVLNCGPPVGHPEPNVYWKRDGLSINKTDQHYTELSGKLIIAPADKSHSGSYVCVASNTVAVRESRAARLTVLEKPVLVLRPQNVSVRMGQSAQFSCQAKGDPAPVVMWSRDQGPLPNGRYLVNPEQSLQIHYVTAQDVGRYTCTAVNDAGVVTASAQLTVQEPTNTTQKDFHKELSSLRVILESVSILAAGSNKSLVQWRLQSFSSQPHYLDGFEVLYRSLLPASSDWAAKKVLMPGFQAQVGPLKRGFKYEFKVRPYGSDLYGRESNTRHLRVPETVPSASPLAVSLTVNHEQNNTVSLSWDAPPHDTHNGIIQGYQVWCVDSEQQQHQNWTVDSSRHQLEIVGLRAGQKYWVSIAAVNGAGVGTLSDPHGFVINPSGGRPADNEGDTKASSVLALLRDPVVIGSIGALLWFVLMVAAVCLYRRHSRTGRLMAIHGKRKGLHRLAGEDLIIKHRMVAPDSPWIAGGWRQGHFNEYQDLWAHSQKRTNKHKSASLPASSKDSNSVDSVPIVTDSCGVYGTFYVDLSGTNLKTFNSPRRCPKAPHGHPGDQGTETIKIFSQPAPNGSPPCGREPLPWKQGIRPQPRMGVSHSKQELHAVNSVPLLSSKAEICSSDAYKQRQSHGPASRHGGHEVFKVTPCPRLLHYSTSVHLVDTLPPPPPLPKGNATETHSLSSDGGSSHSTKLTGDTGSLQSVSTPPVDRGQIKPNVNNSNYSRQSTASYCMSLYPDPGAMTSQEATQYLELSPKPERCSILPEQRPSLPQPLPHSLGFISGAVSSQPDIYSTLGESDAPLASLRRARVQSSPSSCYSDWDSSLWNTWSSVMDRDMASARTSLISSVDSCYTADSAHFARLLAAAAAAAAESMSGASLSDFSPPASPLSTLYPSYHLEGDSFGDLDPVPGWDWRSMWMEEMEDKYKSHYTKPFDC
ncbi:roundabout homolog 4 [Eucyclogobius newberryi]|uniref:roundabout homolog 4 n=1 Tax=Eucyclogobius newberryi TaxID=166745 RepID=UPI003B59F757